MQRFAATTVKTGLTLIELLVVVAIMALLAVTVIPNLRTKTTERTYQVAARSTSAFIASCQSRAIGANRPRGLMLQPLAADPTQVIDVFFADTPTPYSGETASTVAAIGDPLGNGWSVTFSDDPLTRTRLATPGFCFAGDAIQFGGAGPKYKLIPPQSNAACLVQMRSEDNQNIRNTAWPRGNNLPFKIWRQPNRGSGGGLQLRKGAAIDIGACCLGTRPFSTFMTISPSAPISLLFDATAKPSEIVHSGGQRTSVGAPIFLLIGDPELCGNAYDASIAGRTSLPEPEDRTGANWQYTDTIWLSIDNNSGVVKTGNVAGNATNVLDSQRFVRLTAGYGSSER